MTPTDGEARLHSSTNFSKAGWGVCLPCNNCFRCSSRDTSETHPELKDYRYVLNYSTRATRYFLGPTSIFTLAIALKVAGLPGYLLLQYHVYHAVHGPDEWDA